MSSTKPLVFISHITEEKDVALAFKELAEDSFLGLFEVFVSSDADSIRMGDRWLEGISRALKNCAIEIIVCSSHSVTRPWINFEAGAGWVRDIPVIPLCHSGMVPASLPMPLNMLQSAIANEEASLGRIFPVLASALGASTPKVDYGPFVQKIKDFEQNYTFWDECNKSFAALEKSFPTIVAALVAGKTVDIGLSEIDIQRIEKDISFLTRHRILEIVRTGSMKMTGYGTEYGCQFVQLPAWGQTVQNKLFGFVNI